MKRSELKSGTYYRGLVCKEECDFFKKENCLYCPDKDKDFCHGVKELRKQSKKRKSDRLWKMPFGKHKGKHICDVPCDYLEWLKSQDGFNRLDNKVRWRISYAINLKK